ncbi:MAG: putative transport system permease protein, partial [Nocardioidaceae bacterium]|nr:putative transport system permease protein [Nocardioidaceae bacterium]
MLAGWDRAGGATTIGGVGLTRHWGGLSLTRNRRELLAVIVLLGLLGGVALGALAGARRTQSSYPRFLRASNASTMAIDPGPYDPEIDSIIAHWPEVVESATYVAFLTGPMDGDVPDFEQDFETLGTPNGRFFTMDRFTPTSGRRPDPARENEIAVNETAAERWDYHVGQHLDLGTYSPEQVASDSFFEDPPPPLLRTDATIVGIGVFTDEVVQDDTNASPLALVTPAFSERAAPYATYAWQGLQLRHGDDDVAAIKARYTAAAPPGTPQFFRVTSVDTFHAEQAVLPLSLALASFGGIAFAATLVLVSQAVSRQVRAARTDHGVLRALGAGPRALVVASVVGPILALVAGALLAVALAIAGSPLMPVGTTRRVEVDRGVDADWTVLAVGAGLLLALLVGAALATAVRELPHRQSAASGISRRSRLARLASNSGMSPSAVTGLRLAFEPGEGATAVPVRSVMFAGGIAVVTLVAALTFGSSFRSLLDRPALYGWSWDQAILDQSGYGNLNVDRAHDELDARPEIAGWSGGYFGADSLDRQNVPLLGMEPGSSVTPPLLDGRMIISADEVVLGSATADALGKHIGDDVRIGAG